MMNISTASKVIVIMSVFFSHHVWAASDIVAGKSSASMCFNCHGAGGNSLAKNIPNLAAQKPAYIVNQLRAFRTGLRKHALMQGIASSLSDQDMNNIAAYVSTLPAKPAGGDDLQLEAGAKKVANCQSCHGKDLQGMGLTPRLAGQHPHYLMTQLKAFKKGSRKNSMMRGVAMNLSDRDIYVISEYIGQLD